jgi:hypothetical protein
LTVMGHLLLLIVQGGGKRPVAFIYTRS